MIGSSIPISLWEQNKQRAKGTTSKAVSVNQHIKDTLQKVQEAETKLLKQGEEFEIEDIIAMVQGKEKSGCRTLMQLYSYRFKQMEKLKGKDFAPSTLIKFLQFANAVRCFIKDKNQAEDLPLSKVNNLFIANL